MANVNNYMHHEIDLDGCFYLFINKDVKSVWEMQNDDIQEFFNDVRIFLDDYNYGLYIKRNYVFFTYDNNKYYCSISNFECENDMLKFIENYLERNYNITDFCYFGGELD